MPTSRADHLFLAGCAGLIVLGVTLLGIAYWLMPIRVAKHWWHNH